MRIALLTDGIWPLVLGGMQKHSFYLCKYLAAGGAHVDLYHYIDGDGEIDVLQYFSMEERPFIHPVVLPLKRSGRWPGHYLLDSYLYSREAARHILQSASAYDFIYAKGFTAWALVELGKKKRASLPPVGVNFHGFEMFQKPPGFRSLLQQVLLLRVPVKRICRRADVVFSYGGKITGIIEQLGVPRGRIIEVPAGVELSTVADGIMPTADITRFVFLGRYERRKGIEELNTAIAMLPAEIRRKAEFHFIGPVPESRKTKDGIYHGTVTERDHLYRLLRGCDVLLCPSWSEGMPNVILEAMSQGLAIIATNTGATSTMVHHGTGWLIARPDPVLIRDAIESVVVLPRTEIDHRKHNALNHVLKEFTWEKIAPGLLVELKRFI